MVNETCYSLSSGGWAVAVAIDPFQLQLSRGGAVPAAAASAVWSLSRVLWHAHGVWHAVERWETVGAGSEVRRLRGYDRAGATAVEVTFRSQGDSFIFHLAAAVELGATRLAVELSARPDEHFLGFGERFDQLDRRGTEVDLYVVNGASGGRAYKPVPFFMSSAGYGLHIATDQRTIVRLATPDDPEVVSIRCAAPVLDLRVFPGDSFAEILAAYTAVAGRPALPPKWIFGPWKSRDWMQETEETALEDVREGRRLGLAGTVKLVDASWESYYNSFEFHPQKFPDPASFIHEARNLGYRLVLWISPWLMWDAEPTPAYRYCADHGLLIRRPDGSPYVHRLGNSPNFVGSCIDFTNPAAVVWWQEQLRRLIRMGVNGFKTDFGEQVPDDALFFDGSTGATMHNAYPRLYNAVTAQALGEETQGVLLARSAWHGSQAHSAIWAGDQSSDFGPATGLRSVIIAGQNAGLSGFPFWASDIGGYFGVPTDEVFVRWAQFGAFSPIMQVHGTGCREPWHFSPETLAIYRRYAQLHMDLLPYIYSEARRASETGIPIMRALPLDFQDDARAWGDVAEHEYGFGSELLVAPVYWERDRYRHLYVPGGLWRDFWTGEPVVGGRMHRLFAPLDTIPVLARAGAIVPWLHPSASTCLPATDPAVRVAGPDLRLAVYVGADGHYDLYDGTRLAWTDALNTLTVSGSPVARHVLAEVVGQDRAMSVRVTDAGEYTLTCQ